MRAESREVLHRAFGLPEPEERIRAIKFAVAEQFRSTDPRTRVTFTEYFNHTFAPDMVLSWPVESYERSVFLRPNPDPLWIAEELRWLTPSHPIIMTLALPEREADVADRNLGVAAQSSDTLVTDVGAVDEIRSLADPVVDLVAHAMIRGGRGLLTEADAQDVSARTVAGFNAAQQLEEEATRKAVETLVGFLEPTQAGRMTRVLQAVWEGHGGSPSEFPRGPQGLSGPLTPDDIELLLETIDAGDLEFWKRVGRSVNLSSLTKLQIADPSSNLQAFVSANLDRLSARAMKVYREEPYLGEPDAVPRWKVDRGCLGLRGWHWTAYFSPLKDQLPTGDDDLSVPAEIIRERAQTAGLRVTNVQLQRPDLSITFESTGEHSVIETPEVGDLAGRRDVLAKSAVVGLPMARRLTCDLTSGTASGHTNASYGVSELGRYGLPLMVQLETDQWPILQELLSAEWGYEEAMLPLEDTSGADS